MYQASAENWGDTRFIATTRHSCFVMDTQGKGANPVDTLLAALCSCMGHHVREYFVAKGSPRAAFLVSAGSDTAREAPKLSGISVQIGVSPIRLSPPEQAELLAEVQKCKVYGTLRQACRIDIVVINGETQTLTDSAPKGVTHA